MKRKMIGLVVVGVLVFTGCTAEGEDAAGGPRESLVAAESVTTEVPTTTTAKPTTTTAKPTTTTAAPTTTAKPTTTTARPPPTTTTAKPSGKGSMTAGDRALISKVWAPWMGEVGVIFTSAGATAVPANQVVACNEGLIKIGQAPSAEFADAELAAAAVMVIDAYRGAFAACSVQDLAGLERNAMLADTALKAMMARAEAIK